MTDARPHMTPGSDHPITVERSSSHVTVRSGSVAIAETDRALEMREASYPAVLYIPLEDVDQRLLRRNEQHTWCPYKGEASYYDIVDGDGDRSDGAPFGTTPTPSLPSPTSRITWPSTPTGSPSLPLPGASAVHRQVCPKEARAS